MEKRICNACGTIIDGERLEIEKYWGFFSRKDGEIHRLCLCEKCYDEMIQGFAVPVERKEMIELL